MRVEDDLDQDGRRTELEDAVFVALGEVYDLPPEQAVEAAGFVAGQIAAFLADVAWLNEDSEQARQARAALADLSHTCRELLAETDEASQTAARALLRIEAIGAATARRPRISPLALSVRPDLPEASAGAGVAPAGAFGAQTSRRGQASAGGRFSGRRR